METAKWRKIRRLEEWKSGSKEEFLFFSLTTKRRSIGRVEDWKICEANLADKLKS